MKPASFAYLVYLLALTLTGRQVVVCDTENMVPCILLYLPVSSVLHIGPWWLLSAILNLLCLRMTSVYLFGLSVYHKEQMLDLKR